MAPEADTCVRQEHPFLPAHPFQVIAIILVTHGQLNHHHHLKEQSSNICCWAWQDPLNSKWCAVFSDGSQVQLSTTWHLFGCFSKLNMTLLALKISQKQVSSENFGYNFSSGWGWIWKWGYTFTSSPVTTVSGSFRACRKGKPLDNPDQRQEKELFAPCFGQKIILGPKGIAILFYLSWLLSCYLSLSSFSPH